MKVILTLLRHLLWWYVPKPCFDNFCMNRDYLIGLLLTIPWMISIMLIAGIPLGCLSALYFGVLDLHEFMRAVLLWVVASMASPLFYYSSEYYGMVGYHKKGIEYKMKWNPW